MSLTLKHKKNNKKRCGFCGHIGVPASLEIHHIDGNHENNNPDNLLVLCVNCHREAHHKQKRNFSLFDANSSIRTLDLIEEQEPLTKETFEMFDRVERLIEQRKQERLIPVYGDPVVITQIRYDAMPELNRYVAKCLEIAGMAVIG
jgi:hypothetical protein